MPFLLLGFCFQRVRRDKVEGLSCEYVWDFLVQI